MNIGELLRSRAQRDPARIALSDVDANVGYTLETLDTAACRVAAALGAHGVREGDRVAVVVGGSATYVAAIFGVFYAGAVAVPVPLVETPLALAARVTRTRCKLVLFEPESAALVDATVARLADEATHIVTRDVAALAFDRAAPLADGPVALAPGAPALVLATSGTTGTAKGAVIAHASLLLHTSLLLADALHLQTDDRVLATLPFAHSYGLRITLLAPLMAGAEIVWTRRFDAARTLAMIARRQITFAAVVPTMLAAWVELPTSNASDLSSLRWIVSAGAPLTDELARRAEARLGCEVRQAYGMTEATFSTVDAPPAPRVLGSVGRAVLGVEVRAVDDAGAALPAGVTGELAVRGHHAMIGYDDDEEATRALRLPGGFLRSGDLGRVDADGRVWVTDRKKDLIIRGGLNVAPSAVEAALASHPDVAEVVVVGREDPHYGEEIVAIVRVRSGTTPTPESLIAHAALWLARPQLPRELVFIDALPTGASGKIDRRSLRAAVANGALERRRVELP